MGAKFFVHGESAWREVDTSTGRVVGWRGRAKFVYARRGQLHVARSRTVLRALSALAAGEPSAIRDGPRLSHRRNINVDKERIPMVQLSKLDSSTQCCSKIDVSTQIDTSALSDAPDRCKLRINLVPISRWRRKDPHSLDEFEKTDVRRTRSAQRPQLNGDSKPCTRHSQSSDRSLTDFATEKTSVNETALLEPTLKMATKLSQNKNFVNVDLTIDSTDTSEIDFETKLPKRKRILRSTPGKGKFESLSEEMPAKKRKQEITDQTSDIVHIKKNKRKSTAYIRKRLGIPSPGGSGSDSASGQRKTATIKPIQNTSKRQRSPPSDSTAIPKVNNTKTPITQIIDKRQKEPINSSDKVLMRSDQIEAYNFLRRPGGAKSRNACLELVIPEEDVIVLRDFVERTECADLERFDADDDYKRMLFYAINPLVDLEKCSEIEELLEDKRLKQFAERLGLRSVSEVSSQVSAYKTRRRTNPTNNRESSIGSDTDNESRKHLSSIRITNLTQKSINSQNCSKRAIMDRSKNKKENSRHYKDDNINDLVNSRDKCNGKLVRESLKNAIVRMAKVNVGKFNHLFEEKAEETTKNGHDRLQKVSTDISQNASLKRDKLGKFLKRVITEDSGKRGSTKHSEKGAERHTSENIKKSRTIELSDKDRIKTSEKSKSSNGIQEQRYEELKKELYQKHVIMKKIYNDKSQNIENAGQSNRSREMTQKSTKPLQSRTNSKENVPKVVNHLRDSSVKKSDSKVKQSAVLLSDDSSKDFDLEKMANSRTRSAHTISKRPSSTASKEYSNLEDHAIVAYVNEGGRARRVNGNKMWRELEGQYARVTGTKRSWHSLRNRYLRYILPALGALQLPPAQVSRLRAAAATGEIKKIPRGLARRNSIFDKDEPQRGASSLRPRPERGPSPPAEDDRPKPSSDSDNHVSDSVLALICSDSSPPVVRRTLRRSTATAANKSPRYSDVTRQFAARKLRSTPRDSPPTPESPPQKTVALRTRKLFNPKALL